MNSLPGSLTSVKDSRCVRSSPRGAQVQKPRDGARTPPSPDRQTYPTFAAYSAPARRKQDAVLPKPEGEQI